jgi:hypothetical protein
MTMLPAAFIYSLRKRFNRSTSLFLRILLVFYNVKKILEKNPHKIHTFQRPQNLKEFLGQSAMEENPRGLYYRCQRAAGELGSSFLVE